MIRTALNVQSTGASTNKVLGGPVNLRLCRFTSAQASPSRQRRISRALIDLIVRAKDAMYRLDTRYRRITLPTLSLLLMCHQTMAQTLPPAKAWSISDSVMCDYPTKYDFVSTWPGDSPHDVLEQWIAKGNEKCSGVSGAHYTVSYSLNPCTPTIGVSHNGTNPRALAVAHNCTYHRVAEPKPNCVGSCQTNHSDHAAPSPIKYCVIGGGIGNNTRFTLTSPPTYGECMCPNGTIEREGKCIPIIEQTRKPQGDLCVGNPIEPGTGNKRQIETDYVGNGPAPLTFTRVYTSANNSWTSNFDIRVDIANGPAGEVVATLHRPEGSYSFTGSTRTPDPDVEYVLSGSPGSYRVTSPDARRTERFDSQNKLSSVQDAYGKLLYSLSYSTSSTPTTIAPAPGLLIQVTNTFGRSLTFGYDSLSRLASMTDPDGGQYEYAYDTDNNLISVTYPDGTSRHYAYNEPSLTGGANLPWALTGIVDENLSRFASFGYESDGTAILTEYAGGANRHEVSYGTKPQTEWETIYDSSNIARYVRKYYTPPSDVIVTDALGESREYSFASHSGAVRATGTNKRGNGQCSSLPASQVIDSNGNIVSRTDFAGRVTTYEYDLSRNVETARTEAASTSSVRTIATQWYSGKRWPTQVSTYASSSAAGTPFHRVSYMYNGSGDVTRKTVTDVSRNQSRVYAYTYNSYGQLLTLNGPRTDVSDITTYAYYSCNTGYQCGQVHTITNALGHVTTYNSYNAHGQPLTITDPNGVVTTLTYDLRQRLTSRTVGNEVTTFDYWPTGLLKRATLPDGSYIEYTYDAAHRLTDINDSQGNRIHYTLDAMGNRTAEEVFDPSNALVQTRTRVFNTLNQLHKEIGAAGGTSVTTTFGYDNNGNQTDIDAPLGRSTDRTYDELNRLTIVTDPTGGTTHYGYNAIDQLTSVTDPRGKVTSYEYNALGDLLEQVSPDTGTTVFTYDSGGNVKTRTDARGKTATYTYDAINRVTSVSYPDQTITYVYDTGTNQKGRLTQVTDNSGSTSWTYDAQGRVLSREQTMGSVIKTLGYSYDAAGRLDTLTLPSGNTITYSYTNGKVTSLTLNGSTTILSNALYQPFGPTTGWTWGNSTLAVREYDLDGKITDLDSAGLKSYGYDDAFRITSIADATDPSLSQSYGYDLVDRLTSATGTNVNQSWTYDANGNRLTQGGSDPSTYTISSTSNRINSITGSLSRTYGYDAAGNKTSDGVATYSYDDAGRMVSASKSGVSATYSLNALGQRVKKTVAGVSTYFVYDESGHLVGEYDASGNLQQETIWFGDAPVGVLKSNGSGVDLFYIHTDHLNTPRRISRPSDNLVVWRWDSDPFGTTAAIEDADGDSKVFLYNLRFPGQYYDSESGLHYNYFRDYEPATGRYVQSDPMGLRGGLNTYTYALNRPTQLVDSTGLCSCSGGTWRVDFGDLNLSLAFGGYTSFGVVSFTCKSNPSTKCQAYMWCVGGGVMVGAGATISLLGRVNGAPNSQNLQGWSGWQATGSVGPAVGQADGSSGGSVGSGISLGAGLAAIKCNTFSMNCQCNCEK